MKHVCIQFMNHDFCLLSSTEARKTLKTKNFSSIKLSADAHCVLVKIKDLFEIKKTIPLFLLNDDGTELDNSDIEKIFRDEQVSCE